jgi:hypothetical protein
MKCREVKLELHEMVDEKLDEGLNAAVADHLHSCPVCRYELASINAVRQSLRSMPRPEVSENVLRRVRRSIETQLRPAYGFPSFQLVGANDEIWIKRWLMPTSVGTIAAVIFSVVVLGLILIPSNVPDISINTDPNSQNGDPLFLASIDPNFGDQFITPQQFAHSRADVSTESPSINPAGTLVSITSSGSRKTRDEEVVVVAEVFGDGLARITNVVESSKDRGTMDRLQAAFRSNRATPPFVPATLDNRGDSVRVIMKFQSVNVNIDEGGSFR